MKIGYIRVSTEEQNPARQQALLHELGVDEIFIDKASGKNTDRPELQRMMNYVRKGDTVIVESISRFARNTRDLLELIVGVRVAVRAISGPFLPGSLDPVTTTSPVTALSPATPPARPAR